MFERGNFTTEITGHVFTVYHGHAALRIQLHEIHDLKACCEQALRDLEQYGEVGLPATCRSRGMIAAFAELEKRLAHLEAATPVATGPAPPVSASNAPG